MPEAEYRDDRPDRERLEQQADDAATALAAVLVPGVRAERGLAQLRFACPGLDQLTGPGDGGRLQLPPPTLPQVRSRPTTILTPASRGACPRTSATVARRAGLALVP